MDVLTKASLEQIHNLSGAVIHGQQRVDATPRTGWIGLSHHEVRSFSLFSALTQQFMNVDGDNASTLEMKCHKHLRRFFQRTYENSVLIPADVLYRTMDAQPGAKGGYAIGTSMGGFIDSLRSVSILKRLGAQGLSGAQDNLVFPRLISGSPVQWLIPGVPASENSPVFGAYSSSPKIAAAFTEVPEQLLTQMSPETETWLMSTFGRDMAAELDRVGLVGPGGAQILGILNAGIDASVSGTSLTYDGICDLMKVVSEANGVQNLEALGFVTTPTIAQLLKGRQRFPNTGTPIWQGGLAAGTIEAVPAYSTKSMTTGKLLYGDFSNVLIIDWGVMELSLDRSGTLFNRGMVGIRALWKVDVLVLHRESFGVIASIS